MTGLMFLKVKWVCREEERTSQPKKGKVGADALTSSVLRSKGWSSGFTQTFFKHLLTLSAMIMYFTLYGESSHLWRGYCQNWGSMLFLLHITTKQRVVRIFDSHSGVILDEHSWLFKENSPRYLVLLSNNYAYDFTVKINHSQFEAYLIVLIH